MYATSALVLVAACSTSSSPGSPTCASPGGPATGAADAHCTGDAGPIVQSTSPAACHPDAGLPDGGAQECPYGPTMLNTEADDDDCKYHVTWSSTPICENQDVTFTVTATHKTDGSALTGANGVIEAFTGNQPCTSNHPAPNSNQATTEGPPGTYKIGPVRFDVSGQWTVRFHFFQDCDDVTPDSPHGHAAFLVNVP